jgi:LmbE family N-acetylglucosaminyl deacetylase
MPDSTAHPGRVLVIQAHPDDADISSGGTIARWAREGRVCHYVFVTSGNRGSQDPTMTPDTLLARREREARAAAAVLGVTTTTFLRHADGSVEDTLALRRELARLIRQIQADILMTHDPWARYPLHPDHRAVGFAARSAIVTAGNQMIPGEYVAYTVQEASLFHSDQPDHGEDIRTTFETKIQAMQQHASQTRFGEAPVDRVQAWAQRIGVKYGLALAEEFKRIGTQH